LWYWVWRLSAFPPVEATLDAEGDETPLPVLQKRFSPKFLEQGRKLIFKIRQFPLGGSRQMGDVLAGNRS